MPFTKSAIVTSWAIVHVILVRNLIASFLSGKGTWFFLLINELNIGVINTAFVLDTKSEGVPDQLLRGKLVLSNRRSGCRVNSRAYAPYLQHYDQFALAALPV